MKKKKWVGVQGGLRHPEGFALLFGFAIKYNGDCLLLTGINLLRLPGLTMNCYILHRCWLGKIIMINSLIILILEASGLIDVYVFAFAVSQMGMFRGRIGAFEEGCRLNMTDRQGEEKFLQNCNRASI